MQRIRSIDGVRRADNLIVWFVRVALPTGAQEGVQVYAMEDFTRWNLPWNVAEGNPADLRRGKYVMIDDSATKPVWPVPSGPVPRVSRHTDEDHRADAPGGLVHHHPHRVHGPRRGPGDLAGPGASHQLHRRETSAPAPTRGAVAAEIRRSLPYNDVHTRAEWGALSRQYWVRSTGLGLNLFLTVFLGGLVGVVIVAQTLYSSTMEHLREFGTIKAIGAGNREIYGILARQATIAAIGGFAVGAAFAAGCRPLMQRLDLKLIVTGQFWAAVFVGTVLMCLSAAVISFRKVAKLDPAMVFRG